MSRVVNVARIQTVAWRSALGWPWGILAIAFTANLAIFGSMGGAPDSTTTGGLMSIYVVFFISYIQSMTQVLPFAIGLSVSRRTFYVSTALLAIGQSLAYGVVLCLLRLLEDASGGWGMSLEFFGIPYLVHENPVAQVAAYSVPFLLLAFVGVFVGVLHKRWGSNGVLTLCAGVVALVGALVFLVTWQQRWPTVGRWLVDASPLAMVAGWPLLVTLALAASGYILIRRTVP